MINKIKAKKAIKATKEPKPLSLEEKIIIFFYLKQNLEDRLPLDKIKRLVEAYPHRTKLTALQLIHNVEELREFMIDLLPDVKASFENG